MKGVILAGGLGTRLYPLTRITNKHLLPVFNKPMIYYSIEKLVSCGIKEILIVTGGNHAGEFLRLLGNGKEFGLKEIHYTYQVGERGIADALRLASDFAKNDKIIVILGDNIFEAPLNRYVEDFRKQKEGAKILLKEVENPQRFGVAVFKGDKIIKIEEKPKKPKSRYIVTGIYMYDSRVFSYIKKLKLSERKEYEITDVNNMYIKENLMTYDFLEGFWSDCGTVYSLLKANLFMAKRNGINLEELL